MKFQRVFLLLGLSSVLVGCQCMPQTEKLADAVDEFNDNSLHLDGLYRAPLDLTRIGHPDWCQSRFNQFWCRRGCCRQDRPVVMGAEYRTIGEEASWTDSVPPSEQVAPLPPPPAPESE